MYFFPRSKFWWKHPATDFMLCRFFLCKFMHCHWQNLTCNFGGKMRILTRQKSWKNVINFLTFLNFLTFKFRLFADFKLFLFVYTMNIYSLFNIFSPLATLHHSLFLFFLGSIFFMLASHQGCSLILFLSLYLFTIFFFITLYRLE